MLDPALDISAPLSSSNLQRWREFYFLMTLDLHNVEQMLTPVANLLQIACGARACLITYEASHINTINVVSGEITTDIHRLLQQSESKLSEGQLTPIWQIANEIQCVTLPLRVQQEYAGAVHVIDPNLDLESQDLYLAILMLNNALQRQKMHERKSTAERKRIERGLAVQLAVTRVLAEAASLNGAIPQVLQAIGQEFRWDLGVLWFIDHNANLLRCKGFWHAPSVDLTGFDFSQYKQAMSPIEGLTGRVWNTKTPAWTPNLIREPYVPRAFTAAGLHGAFAFPVINHQDLCGVIEFYSCGVIQPSNDVITLMTAIGNQIGQFIERKQAEEVQRATEARYRALVESAFDAIISVTPDGILQSFNSGAERIFGYAASEVIRQPMDLLIPSRLQRQYRIAFQRYVKTHAPSTLHRMVEVTGQRIDGREVLLELTTVCISGPDGPFFTSILRDITERKWAEAEHARLYDELRIERDRLVRREMEVRAQIGRDLHDGPVQQVAVAEVAVQFAQRAFQRAPERVPEALDDLRAQLNRITRDLRTVLYELRPLGIVEEGLASVLRQYVERFRALDGLNVYLEAPADLQRLDPDRETALFIIVQEAVNNVRKHAAASDVRIKLWQDIEAIHVEVSDNGRGFDVQAVERNYIHRGSFGLLNMRERAQLIGANCTISSEPGKGTTIRVACPFA
jgi:PAS domain S-box-containing protein